MTRILVCGSRTLREEMAIYRVLGGYAAAARGERQRLTLIHGEAPGADAIARTWALTGLWRDMVDVEAFPADWSRDGRAAGPLRNQRMLADGKPDVVWAFVDKPLERSRGTADMVRRALAAGIPAYVVTVP